MKPDDSTKVVVTRHFRAEAERVFDAFLDPAKVCRFLFATENGRMTRVELDPRVGGRWTIVENRQGEDVEHFGEYLVIERPRRLKFTLCVPKYAEEVDTVTIDVTAKDQGCILVLTHVMAPKFAEWADGIYEGWAGVLMGLAKVLNENVLNLERSIDIQAPAARVWNVLTDSRLNQEWIGEQLKFSFRVQGLDFQKLDILNFDLEEKGLTARLTITMGDFSDSPEHELCMSGAQESWTLSLPKIREMAERG